MPMTKQSFKGVGMTLIAILASVSCSKVNFSSNVKSTATTPENPGITPSSASIDCQVSLNNNLQTLTLTLPATNPTVTAKCNPSAVTYTWTVTKDNAPVTVNGLQGAQGTPELTTLGPGVYRITLRASAQNYTDYSNEKSPLLVTINNGTSSMTNVTCDPKINGNMTTFNYMNGGMNPQIMANCQPPDASCQWVVMVGTMPVSIPGLSTCTATPDFANQNPGTYQIYLTATYPNYNPYTTTEPLKVIVPDKPYRNITTEKKVTLQDNQLDVQLIIDNSNSMLADNQKLASRLQGFVTDLSAAGFDWQMCTTVTSAQKLTSSDPTLYWGASRYWNGVAGATPWILKPTQANIFQTFQNTINEIGAGWAGTDDERGIKAAWWHLWNGDVRYQDASGCYRKDSGLAVIVISDEDVRSVGGDPSQEYYPGELKTLESDDFPQTYLDLVKDVFGATKRFTVNSIIVRPGDTACMSQQDSQGSKSHYGYKYSELSNLTGGAVTSICESDFSSNLRYFKDQIVKDMASLPLDCNPVGTPLKVTITPAFATQTRVENKTLYFNPSVPAGSTIKAEYQCPQ